MKPAFLIGLTLLFTLELFAQKEIFQESSTFNWGIHAGIEKSSFHVLATDWDKLGIQEISSIEIQTDFGYRFGGFIRYNWKERFQFRMTPGFVIQKNEFQFVQFHPSGLRKIPSFFIGPRAQFGVGSNVEEDNFKLKNNALFAEFGISIAFHTKHFIFQPEAFYSHGLTNLKMDGSSGIYNNAISIIEGHKAGIGLKILMN